MLALQLGNCYKLTRVYESLYHYIAEYKQHKLFDLREFIQLLDEITGTHKNLCENMRSCANLQELES